MTAGTRKASGLVRSHGLTSTRAVLAALVLVAGLPGGCAVGDGRLTSAVQADRTEGVERVQPWAGPVEVFRLREDRRYFRIFGGDAQRIGAWVTPRLPASRGAARRDLALPPGNTAAFYVVVNVPAGTEIRSGVAAQAFGQPGGAQQVELMERIPVERFSAAREMPE